MRHSNVSGSRPLRLTWVNSTYGDQAAGAPAVPLATESLCVTRDLLLSAIFCREQSQQRTCRVRTLFDREGGQHCHTRITLKRHGSLWPQFFGRLSNGSGWTFERIAATRFSSTCALASLSVFRYSAAVFSRQFANSRYYGCSGSRFSTAFSIIFNARR